MATATKLVSVIDPKTGKTKVVTKTVTSVARVAPKQAASPSKPKPKTAVKATALPTVTAARKMIETVAKKVTIPSIGVRVPTTPVVVGGVVTAPAAPAVLTPVRVAVEPVRPAAALPTAGTPVTGGVRPPATLTRVPTTEIVSAKPATIIERTLTPVVSLVERVATALSPVRTPVAMPPADVERTAADLSRFEMQVATGDTAGAGRTLANIERTVKAAGTLVSQAPAARAVLDKAAALVQGVNRARTPGTALRAPTGVVSKGTQDPAKLASDLSLFQSQVAQGNAAGARRTLDNIELGVRTADTAAYSKTPAEEAIVETGRALLTRVNTEVTRKAGSAGGRVGVQPITTNVPAPQPTRPGGKPLAPPSHRETSNKPPEKTATKPKIDLSPPRPLMTAKAVEPATPVLAPSKAAADTATVATETTATTTTPAPAATQAPPYYDYSQQVVTNTATPTSTGGGGGWGGGGGGGGGGSCPDGQTPCTSDFDCEESGGVCKDGCCVPQDEVEEETGLVAEAKKHPWLLLAGAVGVGYLVYKHYYPKGAKGARSARRAS